MMPLDQPSTLCMHWESGLADWNAWQSMALERSWICAGAPAPLADLAAVWDIPTDPDCAWDTHPDCARSLCEQVRAIYHAAQQPMLMGHTHIGVWVCAGHPARFAALRVFIWGLRIASIPIRWIWIGTTNDQTLVRHHLPDVMMMVESSPPPASYQQPALVTAPPAAPPTLPEPSAGPLAPMVRSARAATLRRATPAMRFWYHRWYHLGEQVHRLLATHPDPALLDLAADIRATLAISGLCDADAYAACLHRLRAYETILDRSC